ncbi:M1 family metallopeptidase [Amycolatopsis sp. cg5]|uniref:M1 family metallopeptidase n=1 Tax=Amycolatopsis sp. cg5 TaxID=3238802 RepID=UPI003525A2E8
MIFKAAAPAPGADTSGDSYLPRHGNGGYRVKHYDLELDYRIGPNRLSGKASVVCVATQALSRLSLDFGEFRINRVLVSGKPARFTRNQHKLNVKPQKSLPVGAEFTVEVHYVGNPRPIAGMWGDIGWDELTDGSLVASQPIGAPSWFPCNDHPADKATYRVALTTASPYAVFVTGNLKSQYTRASTTTWVFERTEPTPTYLMSVQIGRYDEFEFPPSRVIQRAGVPHRLHRNFARDFGRQAQIMESLETMFGPYPFDEYVIVVTDDDLDDPIEAQGMSIFGANHVDGRRTHERLVVHELAHQWFGNSLTVADWRHIWLNEGFATYAEWLWSEESGGASAQTLARSWYTRMKAKPADLKIADPGVERMFDERVYKRGALTLHALRHEIGDDAFFALVKAWATEHRHGTVTTREFVATAELYAGRSLRDFFRGWLESPVMPALPGPG